MADYRPRHLVADVAAAIKAHTAESGPLDLLVVRQNECRVAQRRRIEAGDKDFAAMSDHWSRALRDGFSRIKI